MVVILGAGVTGLTAAYELSKKGIETIVIEKDRDLGGVLGSFDIKGYSIEKFYHHVFKGDRDFFSMCHELGLSGKLEWKNTSTGFFSEGRFYNLSGAMHLLFFRLLSPAERMRIALFALRIKSMSASDIRKLDSITARQWITDNLGSNIYRNFFEPLLISKYGEELHEVSAAWFIERMRMRSTRGLTGEKLCYMRGGFHSFISRLAERIEHNGGKIIRGSEASKIRVAAGKVTGVNHSGGKANTGCVISTIPVGRMVSISGMRGEYARRMKSMQYQGTISVLLGIESRLTDYYWTNMIEGGFMFGALVEHTNFIPSHDYAGDHIIYLASYPSKSSRLWKMSSAQIYKAYLSDLQRMLPGNDIRVKWWKVAVAKDAGLVYRRGVLSSVPGMTTPVKGLYTGGMFNSYPDRNINESVRIGRACARLAEDFLSGGG